MADSKSTSKSPPSAHLNPRSCVTCRRRKVKCDKHSPCSNCTKAHIPCIFPERGRAVRRPRKPPDNELLKRLAKLEGVVEELSGQVAMEEGGVGAQFVKNEIPASEKESGRLVIDEGRSRYVDDLKAVLYDDESENDVSSPGSGMLATGGRDGFIFGYHSLATTLREFHPEPNQIDYLWQIYSSNVDPVLKIVHKPTFEKNLLKAKYNLDGLSKGMEALMFAMYFAAVTSLNPEECRSTLQVEKSVLHNTYRFAVEQALARAGFLDTRELIILQAFVIFLVCVRRQTESRRVWTLTGLAIRVAQSLGLHRDGAAFKLSPFETEMRRRLWWQICILDIRSAEDDGSDPSIMEYSFDTKLPLNINDNDIEPETEKTPVARKECTDMTFCLVRFEICRSLRRLVTVIHFDQGQEAHRKELTMKEKEKLIEDCRQMLDERYLSKCDTSVPLHWVSAAVVKLVIAKVYLIIHHPLQHQDGGVSMSQETRDRLFHTSCIVLEYSHVIQSFPAARQWGWLFKTYVQWQAVGFILSELCVRVEGLEVDKAWKAIDTVFREADQFEIQADAKRSQLWRPLTKLLAKATQVRHAHAREKMRRMAMEEASAILPTDSKLGLADYWSAPDTTPSITTSTATIDTLSSDTPLSFTGMDLPMMSTPGSANLGVVMSNDVGLLNPYPMGRMTGMSDVSDVSDEAAAVAAAGGWQWDGRSFQIMDQGWSEDQGGYTNPAAPSIW
ncbi:hypothetical protein FGG08_002143 [Glutinoglossum americanum]|uniref:Zn(2)-C6 fungal-type domain-containing protein n=1 Tax=Glutinoglossum americanum TaxID=1670608 RepID=A0A9P8KZH9_9PEZI|nr:hypothetical protein FGG08_002143 [Glutinoglossum americanum]